MNAIRTDTHSTAVLEWCRSLADVSEIRPLPTRRPGHVLAVEGPDFAGVVKWIPEPRAFNAELRAYTAWAPRIPDHCARLMGASTDLQVVLLSRLPGRTCTDPTPQECFVSGHVLARLQAIESPLAIGSADFSERLRDETAMWLTRGAGLLSQGDVDFVEAVLSEPLGNSSVPTVPCHGDYAPHNWLVSDAPPRWALIDFEHSRYDVPEADLALLWDGELRERPAHQRALLKGYGGLDEEGERRMFALRVAAAVARIVGGSLAGNQHVEQTGRQGLASLAQIGFAAPS